MALFADGDRLLIFCDVNFGFFAVDFYLGDLCWAESFADVFGSIVAPGDDVDFFTVADFVHDGLNTDAATANKGANWVNASNCGGNGDFGAFAGFTGNAANFYGARFDFWDFLAEEGLNKFGTAAGEDELSAAFATFNVFNVNLNTGANGIVFAVDLLRTWHDAVGAAKIDAD